METIYTTILASIASTLISILFYAWANHKINKRIEEIKITNDLKVETYKTLFDIFNSALAKGNKCAENRINLVTGLLLYAPDEIINKYLEFLKDVDVQHSNKSEQNTDFSILYGDILLLIRKDLGYKNSKIGKKTVLNLLGYPTTNEKC